MNIKTTNELAYIDGNVLFDDAILLIHELMPPNSQSSLSISSEPLQEHIRASKIGEVGNASQYKSKHGIFSVCNTSVIQHGLGKQFYFKINK